ncbi:MAG TPA: uroporphyrinogen decarboxylase family protein, partial [Spirochaetota bacterium]|nr:uroporphyrinogen decarboxylase family protein [Spirochaetota bacterium]
VSQISADAFSRFLSKPYQELFTYLKEKNVKNAFFVCGDASRNLENMAVSGTDCLSIDENIDIKAAKKITDRAGIVLSGNLPLTSVMLLGNQQDNRQAALDLMDTMGNDKFILAPGCDMPYDTPTDNIVAVAQTVEHPEGARNMLANYKKELPDIDLRLPDYANLNRPLVEVITVDSAMCAACGYMKEAAMDMKKIFGDQIDVTEYKITEPENIVRTKKLNVTALPAILLNGEVRFVSMIPRREELEKEIRNCL